MSFALDYRKKMQAESRAAVQARAAQETRDTGFVVTSASDNTDTRRTRRQVLAALSLAGIILSLFNSDAMVRYAGGLADSSAGEQIILAAEDWHSLMEENRLTLVVEQIRGAVSYARYSQWPDLASAFAFGPAYRPPARDTVTPVDQHIEDKVPGEGEPVDQAIEENVPGKGEPEFKFIRPTGPVMRAAIR